MVPHVPNLSTSQSEQEEHTNWSLSALCNKFQTSQGHIARPHLISKWKKREKEYRPFINRISFGWFVWCPYGQVIVTLYALVKKITERMLPRRFNHTLPMNSKSLSDKYQPGFLLFPLWIFVPDRVSFYSLGLSGTHSMASDPSASASLGRRPGMSSHYAPSSQPWFFAMRILACP